METARHVVQGVPIPEQVRLEEERGRQGDRQGVQGLGRCHPVVVRVEAGRARAHRHPLRQRRARRRRPLWRYARQKRQSITFHHHKHKAFLELSPGSDFCTLFAHFFERLHALSKTLFESKNVCKVCQRSLAQRFAPDHYPLPSSFSSFFYYVNLSLRNKLLILFPGPGNTLAHAYFPQYGGNYSQKNLLEKKNEKNDRSFMSDYQLQISSLFG